MGGAAVYRYEAVEALGAANLLGANPNSPESVCTRTTIGLCLFATGFTLGEFGNRLDDLPMGVKWKGLPADPNELLALGKSIIHSTKGFEGTTVRVFDASFKRLDNRSRSQKGERFL